MLVSGRDPHNAIRPVVRTALTRSRPVRTAESAMSTVPAVSEEVHRDEGDAD